MQAAVVEAFLAPPQELAVLVAALQGQLPTQTFQQLQPQILAGAAAGVAVAALLVAQAAQAAQASSS